MWQIIPIFGNVETKGIGEKVGNKIKEHKAKEREEKRSRHVEDTPTLMERVTQKNVEIEDKDRFNNAWFIAVARIASEKFHNNFKAGFRAHPLGYKGFGLGVTSQQQITTRKQRRRKMQLVRHVPTKLQPSIQ
jgi:hypothetical protein